MKIKKDSTHENEIIRQVISELLSFTARITQSMDTANSAALVFAVIRTNASTNTEMTEKINTQIKGKISVQWTGTSRYIVARYESTDEVTTVIIILIK